MVIVSYHPRSPDPSVPKFVQTKDGTTYDKEWKVTHSSLAFASLPQELEVSEGAWIGVLETGDGVVFNSSEEELKWRADQAEICITRIQTGGDPVRNVNLLHSVAALLDRSLPELVKMHQSSNTKSK